MTAGHPPPARAEMRRLARSSRTSPTASHDAPAVPFGTSFPFFLRPVEVIMPSLFSLFRSWLTRPAPKRKRPRAPRRIELESLEGRSLPSATPAYYAMKPPEPAERAEHREIERVEVRVEAPRQEDRQQDRREDRQEDRQADRREDRLEGRREDRQADQQQDRQEDAGADRAAERPETEVNDGAGHH